MDKLYLATHYYAVDDQNYRTLLCFKHAVQRAVKGEDIEVDVDSIGQIEILDCIDCIDCMKEV